MTPFVGPITSGASAPNTTIAISRCRRPESDLSASTKTRSIAAYIFEDAAINGQFSLQGAARVEWTSVKAITTRWVSSTANLTPASFGGAVFKPMPDTSLFANVSGCRAAPTPSSLFAQGPHDTSKTSDSVTRFGPGESLLDRRGVKYRLRTVRRVALGLPDKSPDSSTAPDRNTRDADGTFHPNEYGEFKELFYRQNDATFWGFEAPGALAHLRYRRGPVRHRCAADYVRATPESRQCPAHPAAALWRGVFYESTLMGLKAGVMRVRKQNKIEAHRDAHGRLTTPRASAIFHVYRGRKADVELP